MTLCQLVSVLENSPRLIDILRRINKQSCWDTVQRLKTKCACTLLYLCEGPRNCLYFSPCSLAFSEIISMNLNARRKHQEATFPSLFLYQGFSMSVSSYSKKKIFNCQSQKMQNWLWRTADRYQSQYTTVLYLINEYIFTVVTSRHWLCYGNQPHS